MLTWGVGDFAIGAFDEVPNDVLSVVVSVFRNVASQSPESVALQPTPPDDRSYDRERTLRKRAATLCHEGTYRFDPRQFGRIDMTPIVYWWPKHFVDEYCSVPKVGQTFKARSGAQTSDDVRFCLPWEVPKQELSRYLAPVIQHFGHGCLI